MLAYSNKTSKFKLNHFNILKQQRIFNKVLKNQNYNKYKIQRGIVKIQ